MSAQAVPSPADLCELSALDMAALVRRREVSPVDLIRAHLDRIERADPVLRAFQLVRDEKAMAEAAALATRKDLADLPLAGVPIAIKDNVDVEGEPTRNGSAATPARDVDADDELVRRLRAAGCIVIGKTQLPEFAIWPFTEPQAFAATRNPWRTDRGAGGSTGGGAAAVAAGMAAIALGSDGGGSIRIPAACCGVFGIKPGSDVVPTAGGRQQHWFGLTQYGPLTRTVADAALALDVLAGRNTYRDPSPPSRLRIAWSAKHPLPGAKPSPAALTALEQTANVLNSTGHALVHDSPKYPAALGLRFNQRWLAGIAEDVADLDPMSLERRTRQMARIGARLAGRTKPAADDPFGSSVTKFFASYDVLVTPTLTRPPAPIGAYGSKGWFATMLAVANWIYTPPWNVAGLPAASVPCGLDQDGMPLAVQLIGRAGSERTLLNLAARIEQLRPWPQLAPPTAAVKTAT